MKAFKLFFLFLGLSTLLLSASLSARHDSEKGCAGGVPGTLVDATGLDGCGWLIELDNGTTLEPVGLSQFALPLVDGKRISVTYTLLPNSPSICMVGPKARITCMTALEKAGL